jgi:hypothetical protein
MLSHPLHKEFEYLGHVWINKRRECGCITAICLDVEPTTKDRDFIVTNSLKKNSLQTIIKESFGLFDENQSQKFEEFKNELIQTQKNLEDFVREKREQHNFPMETTCAYEYYFIKIQQGQNCHN